MLSPEEEIRSATICGRVRGYSGSGIGKGGPFPASPNIQDPTPGEWGQGGRSRSPDLGCLSETKPGLQVSGENSLPSLLVAFLCFAPEDFCLRMFVSLFFQPLFLFLYVTLPLTSLNLSLGLSLSRLFCLSPHLLSSPYPVSLLFPLIFPVSLPPSAVSLVFFCLPLSISPSLALRASPRPRPSVSHTHSHCLGLCPCQFS